MGALGLGAQRPRAGGVLAGAQQRLRPFLEHGEVRGSAIPTFAHTGDATVLRPQQCPHRLLQVRPVLCGGAVGDGNGVRIPLRDVRATARTAGRVARIDTQGKTCLGTDRKRQVLQQPVAARGRGCIERAATRKAVAHLGIDALTTQQIEGGWAQHWGVNDQGRVATPTPLRILPATASPGVLTACASGTSRVVILSISPQSLLTAAIPPQCSRRSTRICAICQPSPDA